jgi:hypothetical protein
VIPGNFERLAAPVIFLKPLAQLAGRCRASVGILMNRRLGNGYPEKKYRNPELIIEKFVDRISPPTRSGQ